ncbi:ribulose-phosphate 3-epimerase [Salpingoeca rosetta]|uniref:Ribulose-phosphate 3-epimerase n=1 Tax=Salpingoeca rosetta (strain ATCC 50818 / BSB-021) TaxID=946362 RepID=F2UCI0_SALR5|nr:ribulose-phosphate 3-epimerase [Salpingoeca rosetta]EGD74287.1 ribulose-phosphate 3-epimerase [Salpingoeca rosetta]|eukprot:XP_004993187.1 ribulose-phosphate 3-epimerase [Salpingoeca rosetta]
MAEDGEVAKRAKLLKPAEGQGMKTASGLPAQVGPSILASDLSMLAADSKKAMEQWTADYLHVDIMDGHFVPNLTIGPPVVKCLRKHTTAFLDCHLMVSNPEHWVKDMAAAGADRFTFHFEATNDADALIEEVNKTGMKCGMVIKPKTPVDVLFPYLDRIDLVLIMTVEPGFGGQSFMVDMMDKVKTLRAKSPKLNIEVDGGLNLKTIDTAAKAGANMIVAGSAVFKAEDPKLVVQTLRDKVVQHCP